MKQERSRAIIIKENKILLVKRTKIGEIYWACPGGLIEEGESREGALIREVKEETGLYIKVRDLFISLPSQKPGFEGQMEYFYFADVIGGELGTGDGPELQPNTPYSGTYEFEWYDVSDLSNMNLYPEKVKNFILNKYRK